MENPSGFALSRALLCVGVFAVVGCSESLEIDLRDSATGLGTADAARQVRETRPMADARGVISYPDHQVAIARESDTVTEMANRLGIDADDLARHNGLEPETSLRQGEFVALPTRVEEFPADSSADGTGSILPNDEIDITTLARDALDRVESTTGSGGSIVTRREPSSGTGSIRHQVERGETAYSIARLYNVSVRSLADWNKLDPDLSVKQGQYLIIPSTVTAQVTTESDRGVAAPGEGSLTPVPPSASTPLPEEDPDPAPKIQDQPTSPAERERSVATRDTRLIMPVSGDIIRAYEKGRYDGIDIDAGSGSPVAAAADGNVAVVTLDTDYGKILVLRHPDNLLTVYANVDNLSVGKGDAVSRGQTIAEIGSDASYLHFEVREGVDSVDPLQYLN